MSRMWFVLLTAAACLVVQPAQGAQDPSSPSAEQALAMLQKIQTAARELDYSGIYTYQQGAVMVSSRIVHLVDGTGERERLELLDGAPREFLRHNDTTQCLIPDKKTVVIERRRGDRFPALLLDSGENIPEHYDITVKPSPHRIASRECTMMELSPKDAHRYGYRLCADTKTNLLLKAQTISPTHGLIDQLSFNSLQIGEKVAPEQLVSNWNTKGWKVLEVSMTPVDLVKNGWRIPLPDGFETITQVNRPMKQGRQVSQLVLTDGLAAISVFIEPYDSDRKEPPASGMARAGAMNIFQARIGDHWLTALGEVPAETLRAIAEHTEYVPLSGH